MLYLVATPIGNLKDITFRAIEILKNCDYILCEDTRHSIHLLQHYEIQKPLKSFHKFSEAAKENDLIEELQSGKIIALISDAGTPGISDPGARLVEKCVAQNIPVQSIPGACAAVTALTCSGLDTDRFQFFGFLPKKQEELRAALRDLLNYPGTSICYESPNRVIDTVTELAALAPDRQLVVARELTKKFEEIKRGKASVLAKDLENLILKGEIVLLIAGRAPASVDWSAITPEEHVQWMQKNYSLTKQEAIKMVAEIRGVPKRTIYNTIIKN